jgi:hypothetical protein
MAAVSAAAKKPAFFSIDDSSNLGGGSGISVAASSHLAQWRV